MRIMHLLQSPRFSGAENVVCQIIGLFKNEENYEMLYCSRDGQIREALEERHIPFEPLSELSIKEVKTAIRKWKPDIIHAHDMRATYIAVCAANKTPVISHIHNNNFDSRKIGKKALAYLLAALKTKHIFWVSDTSFNGYIFNWILRSKSEVLYNVINISDLRNKAENDNNEYSYDVVYLGRLTPQKNPMKLLNVFQQIISILPSVKIAIIGTGELEQDVRLQAEQLGILNNVDFLGFMNNPYKVLQQSKVLILTSLWEGTPMCVLEAMSLGVPVVSTPTDGVITVIEDSVTGFLEKDDIALANRCCQLVEDDVIHNQMSRACIERAEKIMDMNEYKRKIKIAYDSATKM